MTQASLSELLEKVTTLQSADPQDKRLPALQTQLEALQAQLAETKAELTSLRTSPQPPSDVVDPPAPPIDPAPRLTARGLPRL